MGYFCNNNSRTINIMNDEKVVSLLIGKENSKGVPGKNYRNIVGRPMCEYSYIASTELKIKNIFVSTDSPKIKAIGKKYNAKIIDRPKELAQSDSLTEDVLIHASTEIEKQLGYQPEIVCLLFANNPAIDIELIKKGINLLQNNSTIDSAFSVCRYDMFSPIRARRIDKDGLISPAVPLTLFGDSISSIRDSQGGIYFCDLSIQVMKWRCFTNMEDGNQPFKWMGQKSKALINDFGFDVDSEWQFKVIEYWLRKRGFTEDRLPFK